MPGREQELLVADERLSRLFDLHELVGRVDVFTAARGYGKTSLLREIQRRAEARDATTAWVTAGEEHGLVAAVVEAFAATTRTWRDAGKSALQLAVQAAGGYPFTVQLIGQHAWELAGFPDAGAVITAEIAQQSCERTQQEMARLIEDRFARSSPAEQQFMLAMAAAGDEPARRAEIVGLTGVSSNHVSNQRDSLLKNGLIRSASHGTVGFTIPGMAAYLRTRTEFGPRPR